jgi:hypothetical protein
MAVQRLPAMETARGLLSRREPQQGLFELYRLALLHASMEAVVQQAKFRSSSQNRN